MNKCIYCDAPEGAGHAWTCQLVRGPVGIDPSVDSSETRHAGWDPFNDFLCGIQAGNRAHGIADITCEACRAALKFDKCAPAGWDPWKVPEIRGAEGFRKALQETIVGALMQQEREMEAFSLSMVPALAALPRRAAEPEPTTAERYAAFRETVERVVAEEAPAAKVITDWSGSEGQVWVELGGVSYAFQLELVGGSYDQDVRNLLADFSYELGARAMGKR